MEGRTAVRPSGITPDFHAAFKQTWYKWGVGFRGDPYFLIDAKLFPGSSGCVLLSKPVDMVMSDGRLLIPILDKEGMLWAWRGARPCAPPE